MTAILAAFQFLTIFPTIIQRRFTAQEMGRAVGWFPTVGLALGLVLYGVNHAAQWILPATVAAALTLAAWVMLTRAFHLDGFMDTCDGLFGGFTPERRLEIMKDSRVGVFGVAGGVLILLTKFSALASSLDLLPALVLGTTLGRWASPLVIFLFPYGREDGLGIEMKREVRWPQVALATGITLITSWLVRGWIGLALMLAAALLAFLIAWYIMRLIPGLTGDSYGTVTEAVETLALLFFAVRL
jgi:adenosylcobinamide-GDP ribazoletransferase